MPIFESEDKFSNVVLEYLREKLGRYDPNLKIGEKMQVISGFTIGKDRKGEWKIIMGSLQQDIVIYRDEIPVSKFKSDILKMTRKTGVMQDSVTDDDKTVDRNVIVPLLIIELKIGQNLQTHAFINYSNIAQIIKNVFPHVSYFFLLDSNEVRNVTPETVVKYTKGFDRVFLEWGKEKEILWQDIESHLKYLKRLEIL